MTRKIRLGIPSKGRLQKPCLDLLAAAGLSVLETNRKYISPTNNPNIDIVFARAFDIPLFVEHGSIDLGITGYDLVLEREVNVHNLTTLNFGKCYLVIATPINSDINKFSDITNFIKISTEYPNIVTRYFQSLGIQTEIFELRGATELAPKLGLSDLIVDITSTGTTLRKNGLRVISTILASSCILISNKISYRIFEDFILELTQKITANTEGDKK